MIDFLQGLFGTSAFMPHGHCYLWTPALLWTEVITNGLIAAAYFAIAAGLAVLVHRVDSMPFGKIYWAFSLFIFACGVTHLFDIVVIWEPRYWIDAGIRVVTAVASVGTAILLIPFIPTAVKLIRGARSAMQKGVQLESVVDDLESMYEQTKELERRKTEFFANVSHELRTPLTLVLGRARNLLESESLKAEDREAVSSIVDNSELLLKHVQDLLDIARHDADRLETDVESIDFGRLIRRITGAFDGLADDCNIDYRVEGPSSLHAEMDDDQIETVVMNLLSNAFKFTPDGGTIRVEYGTIEGTDDDRVQLTVQDSGPGVPPDQREAIFERFHQEDLDKASRFGGTGLGLVIVRNLVEMHGGEVYVEDAPEGGARFVVRMPKGSESPEIDSADERATEALQSHGLASSSDAIVDHMSQVRSTSVPDRDAGNDGAEADQPAASDEEAPDESSGSRVLVVEDNAEMNEFICELLTDDFVPIPVFDGTEALNTLETESIDLVITDLMMPEMDGVELIDRLKADPTTANIPILVLTAKADRSFRTTLLRKGVDDFIPKPFSSEELLARVSNLLSIHRTRLLLQRELESRGDDLADLASELSNKTSELEHLALYDQLTGLPNRTLLEDRIDRAIERAKRHSTPFAIGYIDLDGFKGVNDSLGHAAGDELMKQSAERLRETFRGEDTVARVGGDEFVVLIGSINQPTAFERIGGRVADAFEPTFDLDEKEVEMSVSIGFVYPPPSQFSRESIGVDINTLIQRADAAMYEAKEDGGTSWHIVEFEAS